MEGVLSCLNLVQVSSEGLMESYSKKGGSFNNNVEGDGVGVATVGKASVGDYLQLTVVGAMGRKYLNVDTTTKDGIDRAKVSVIRKPLGEHLCRPPLYSLYLLLCIFIRYSL